MQRQYLGWFVLLLLACALKESASFQPENRRTAKLSEAEWNSYYDRDENGPGTYSFGYDVEDQSTGNTQFRQEERFPNGTVEGSYGLQEPDGNVRVVYYTADHLGYRVKIENSIRKNEDYPPHPQPMFAPIPSMITQKSQNPEFYSKVSPPEYISNSVENTPVHVPQLIYSRKKFYPYYFNRQTTPNISSKRFYFGQ